MDHIAVVGASLAGLRAAQELRRAEFGGRITFIGDEPHLPYDRPPLSKDVLAGTRAVDAVGLIAPDKIGELDLHLMFGSPADGLDIEAHTIDVGGSRLGYDGLVIATGCRPRSLPDSDMVGVHTLRTRDDSVAIRERVANGARNVVVIGAGFIGAEVAATCRGLGCNVTMVDVSEVPMERGLGRDMGLVMADVHRAEGVDLRLGVGVVGLFADDKGDVREVALDDGSVVPADMVVVGIGVIPNTEWLEGSGLTIDNGVVCDATLLAAPGIVGAGDIVRWPNQLFEETMRVEHWDNAAEQGAVAARRLLTDATEATPFTPVPWFWSDQFDRKIQVTGRTNDTDEVTILAGAVGDNRFVAGYRRGSRLSGAFGMNWPRQIIRLRAMIADAISFDDAVTQLAFHRKPEVSGGV